MKAQINVRTGKNWTVLARFNSKKEAEASLKQYLRMFSGFEKSCLSGLWYNKQTNTSIWVSRRFTPAFGVY